MTPGLFDALASLQRAFVDASLVKASVVGGSGHGRCNGQHGGLSAPVFTVERGLGASALCDHSLMSLLRGVAGAQGCCSCCQRLGGALVIGEAGGSIGALVRGGSADVETVPGQCCERRHSCLLRAAGVLASGGLSVPLQGRGVRQGGPRCVSAGEGWVPVALEAVSTVGT